MIVDILNTNLRGGAAIAAIRQHEALLAAGVDSRFWHSRRSKHATDAPQVAALGWPRPWLKYVTRRLRQKLEKRRYISGRPSDLEVFSQTRYPTPTTYQRHRLQGDILHLHWISRWLDLPTFFASIPDGLPIVWTLHDMNPMTGGCHHADDCDAFTHECASCPQLTRSGPRDLANRSFHAKRRMLHGKDLHIVTPSRWLESLARKSDLLGPSASIQTIRNGLDLRVFAPRNRQESRRMFQIPGDKVVIGFGAAALSNRRKGFRDLQLAMTKLRDITQVVGLGFGEQQLASDEALPELKTVGYLTDEEKHAHAYAAMDFFVLPSWAENMPQTAVEAMACGTPVIAYDVGGVPEIVKPMQTGLLAQFRDTSSLAEQMQLLVDQPDARRRFGQNARSLIEQQFGIGNCIKQYLDLYRAVTNERNQRAA